MKTTTLNKAMLAVAEGKKPNGSLELEVEHVGTGTLILKDKTDPDPSIEAYLPKDPAVVREGDTIRVKEYHIDASDDRLYIEEYEVVRHGNIQTSG